MTNNEVRSFSYQAEGNRIEEQDIPLLAASRERRNEAHPDFAPSAPTYVVWRETDGRLVSVLDVADTSELVVETVSYDNYGNLLNDTNAANDGAALYTASYSFDGNAELLLSGSCVRYYDPTPGRWLKKDPVGFEAGTADLYSYVGNDPTEASE